MYVLKRRLVSHSACVADDETDAWNVSGERKELEVWQAVRRLHGNRWVQLQERNHHERHQVRGTAYPTLTLFHELDVSSGEGGGDRWFYLILLQFSRGIFMLLVDAENLLCCDLLVQGIASPALL